MSRFLPLLVLLIVLLVSISGCGSHGPVLPGPAAARILTGVVSETNFVVPAGQRFTTIGDVVIRSETADVQGELVAQASDQPGQDGSSITIEAEGDIAVTGKVEAGSGVGGNAEGDGGDGGDVALTSANGDITLGGGDTTGDGSAATVTIPVAAGNGGEGGGGLLGGPGGNGGDLTIEAGVLTIAGASTRIHVGNGGRGGDAIIGGQDLLTTTLPPQMPNHGGNGGALDIKAAEVWVGGESVQGNSADAPAADPPTVVVGGEGRDAGYLYYGTAPNTGSTWPGPVDGGTAQIDFDALWANPVQGAAGGDGFVAGDGQNIWAIMPNGIAGTNGGSGHFRAGHGGQQETDWFGMAGFAGDGGKAAVQAGHGGPGGECTWGGEGGMAIAVGGDGGDIVALSPTGWKPVGNGGNADAWGGQAGPGGDCCTPPARGGAGGSGGDAYSISGNGGQGLDGAYEGLPGGSWATGGDGAYGGDGETPGKGGGGGAGLAKVGLGKGTVPSAGRPGKSGANGGNCPKPPPPTPDPDDIIGRIIPTGFTYTIKLYIPTVIKGSDQSAQSPTTTTDADGYYVFKNVQPGEYRLIPDLDEAAPPNYWFPAMRWVTKVAGTPLTDQDFELKTGGKHSVTVEVRDQNNQPMAGLDVVLYGYTVALGDHNATTGADGKVVIPDVNSGLHYLQVTEIPPAGFEWSPARAEAMVDDQDTVAPVVRLVPE